MAFSLFADLIPFLVPPAVLGFLGTVAAGAFRAYTAKHPKPPAYYPRLSGAVSASGADLAFDDATSISTALQDEGDQVEATVISPPPEPPPGRAPLADAPPAPDVVGQKPDQATLAKGLNNGLAKTRGGWVTKLGSLFSGKKTLDPALMDEVERILFTADIGVKTSQKLIDELRAGLDKKELSDAGAAWRFLKKRATEILTLPGGDVDFTTANPFVLLIVGVNGAGKTTTIGKLASKWLDEGRKVVLAAGDTFRAAAVDQLEVWGRRSGAAVVRGKEGADPSSVIFDGVKKGQVENADIVIADTAGRLHTKSDLMDELVKTARVTGKAMEGAPHQTWLVLDSTSGQNAIAQAKIFTEAMNVTGLVLTKLDGTAKGGVILGIADQMKIPVRYIGVGERVEDLQVFDPEAFADALFGAPPE